MADRDAPPNLPDGTPYDEGVSALIKSLRRGRELEAAYWAAQLSIKFPEEGVAAAGGVRLRGRRRR